MRIPANHPLGASLLLLGGQLLSSCGAPTAQTATASPSPASSSSPTARPPTAASAAANPSPTAATPAATMPTSEVSPFHVVATGPDLDLITSRDDLILFDGSQLLAKVEGDRIVNHPEYLSTYPGRNWDTIGQLGGKWPDAGWISVDRHVPPNGDVSRYMLGIGYSELYEKAGKHWRLRAQTQEGERYASIQEWDRGQKIALVRGSNLNYRWKIVNGTSQTAPKPKTDKAVCCDNCLGTVMSGDVFAVLPTGHLFALGGLQEHDCDLVDKRYEPPAVERWEPNQIGSQLDIMPTPADRTLEVWAPHLAVFAPDDANVFGAFYSQGSHDLLSPYWVHFDGTNWTMMSFPSFHGIDSMSASDGVLWATSGGALWKKADAQSPWVSVPVPNDPSILMQAMRGGYVTQSSDGVPGPETAVRPLDYPLLARAMGKSISEDAVPWQLRVDSVLARPGGDVWIKAMVHRQMLPLPRQYADVILRNRPHSEVWHSLEREGKAQAIEQYQPWRAASYDCDSIFVLLYAVTRSMPKDYDYPLTRAALKGHPEFADVTFAETEDRGQHYFGAFVPELSLGQRLLAVVHKKVKDSKSVMVCRHPKKVRLLEFDLATGAVTKNAKVEQ